MTDQKAPTFRLSPPTVTYPPGAMSAREALKFEKALSEALRSGFQEGYTGTSQPPVQLIVSGDLDAALVDGLRRSVQETWTIGVAEGAKAAAAVAASREL